MRRDLLTPRTEPSRRDGTDRRDAYRDREPERPPIEMTVLPAVDEPTWEVRQPGTERRLDRRTRSILGAAAAAAIIVNAGAAWAYWKVTGSETGSVRTGTAIELALRGRSNLNRPLAPGHTGNLTVTVTNDNDFPIRVTSVTPGAGNIVADDEHRDAGCMDTAAVTMTRAAFPVSWDVARNTVGAFTIPDGLRMAAGAHPACRGAVFSVPIQAGGVSGTPDPGAGES